MPKQQISVNVKMPVRTDLDIRDVVLLICRCGRDISGHGSDSSCKSWHGDHIQIVPRDRRWQIL